MNLRDFPISDEWTLFLDRDGVINRRIVDDYVKSWSEFEFLDGVIESIVKLRNIFGRIIVVTNQQCVGKGLMAANDLKDIHRKMKSEIKRVGGRLDKIYYCPFRKDENSFYRKPEVGMGLWARKDFPEIKFGKSIIVGDSVSDMEFGRRLKMFTVFISENLADSRSNSDLIDFTFPSLKEFTDSLLGC